MGEVKDFKTAKDLLRDGNILKSYTLKNFAVIRIEPELGKVLFSIVDKGSAGKNHIDFYLDIEEARKFFHELKSGIAQRKFLADKDSAEPSAYEFITGEKGSKHLQIGGGGKGIRLKIRNASGAKLCILPLKELETAAFYFDLVTGLIPVTSGYYNDLRIAFFDGLASREKMHRSPVMTEEDVDYHIEEDATPASVASSIPQDVITFATTSPCVNGAVKCTVDGKATTLLFSKEQTEKLSWYTAFVDGTKQGSKSITAKVVADEEGYHFVEIAKKSA